jgi:hypothetical protein
VKRFRVVAASAGKLITSMEGKKPDDRFYSSVTGILSLPRLIKNCDPVEGFRHLGGKRPGETDCGSRVADPQEKDHSNEQIGSQRRRLCWKYAPAPATSEPETDAMGRQVATSQGEEDERIAAGKKAIIDEILNLAATANDVRAKKRYEIAARVAERECKTRPLGH